MSHSKDRYRENIEDRQEQIRETKADGSTCRETFVNDGARFMCLLPKGHDGEHRSGWASSSS